MEKDTIIESNRVFTAEASIIAIHVGREHILAGGGGDAEAEEAGKETYN